MRVILSLINLAATFVSLDALVSHGHRFFFQNKTQDSRQSASNKSDEIRATLSRMVLGCGLNLAGAIVRLVYFARGPFLSTTAVYFTDHIFMLYSGITPDILTTLVCVSLFLRWGAFGSNRSWLRRHCDRLLVALGVLLIAMMLAFCIVQTTFAANSLQLLLGYSVIALLIILVSSALFIFAGIRFIRQLKQAATMDPTRIRSLNKATHWITISGFFLAIQVIGHAMSSNQTFLFSPAGAFTTTGIVGLSTSLTSLAHAFAFRPAHHGCGCMRLFETLKKRRLSIVQRSSVVVA
eukprot:c11469_g1_i1.p1 GENE.c11469_g1_i1~~c11469_g1_i1.p1  ORF type:complete len:294 (+),score=65.43 c11469_g1_i1:182-1063(+)